MQYSLVVRYVCCVWRFVILSDPALPHRHRRDSGPDLLLHPERQHQRVATL